MLNLQPCIGEKKIHVLMMILISPAKSLDFETVVREGEHSRMVFEEEASYLAAKLKKASPRKLKSMMDISENLAQLNAERYQNWQVPELGNASKQAVFAFQGDVYQGLKAEEWNDEELRFGQDHLRILSGLYGLLKPLDLIQPYRLEMGTTWKITPAKTNLYKFWKEKITKQLAGELKSTNSKFILNLASQEYSNAVDFKKLALPVVSPEFKEEKGDKFQMISFFAKKARGLMATFAIRNQIETPEELMTFDYEGYTFNERLSDVGKNKWVFTRKSQTT
jgi:cytoplasmic iron level regulating protein YaaA (DUF328/UPF0246 family)